jgi:hypothetical protein
MSDDDVRLVASTPRRSGGRGRGAALALAVAAALVVGLLIGRLTAPADDKSEPAAPSRDGGAAVGPVRAVDGVPVGYARSRDGATAALLNYSVVLSRLLLDPPERRRAALEAMGIQAFVATTADQLDRARRAADQGPLGAGLRAGATTLYRGAPVGYRVVRYSDQEAVIETWAFGLVANTTGLGPQMTFQTATSTLRFEDGDWKLAASTSRPGPTPRVTGDVSAPRDFVDAIGPLKGLRFAP